MSGTFSLDDLDKIIEAEDPNFKSAMEGIREAGSAIDAEIESLNVDPDEDLVSEKEERQEKDLKRRVAEFLLLPWTRLQTWIKLKRVMIKNRLILFGQQTLQFIRHELPERVKYFRSRLKVWALNAKALVVRGWDRFHELTRVEKAGFFFTVFAAILSVMFLRFTFTGSILPTFSDPLVSSLESEAGFVYSYKGRNDLQDLFQAFPEVGFPILLKKVVVNLRPDENSGRNPMGAYEMYLELDSQDTAIEVKDREKEILDIIQRALETFTYTEVNTKVGKIQMKSAIMDRVNQVLNQGRVQHVYFNTFITSP